MWRKREKKTEKQENEERMEKEMNNQVGKRESKVERKIIKKREVEWEKEVEVWREEEKISWYTKFTGIRLIFNEKSCLVENAVYFE